MFCEFKRPLIRRVCKLVVSRLDCPPPRLERRVERTKSRQGFQRLLADSALRLLPRSRLFALTDALAVELGLVVRFLVEADGHGVFVCFDRARGVARELEGATEKEMALAVVWLLFDQLLREA